MVKWPRLAFAALLSTTCAGGAKADAVADFYKGKTFSIIVGHQSGTGFDLYARVLSRHMGRHIPGNPNIVVQNMNGASGLRSLNWLANVGPKDGTAMATMVFTAPFEPLMGNGKGKFDPRKFWWIGNMNTSVSTCGFSKAAGIKTVDDLFKKEVLVGGTARAGPLSQVPSALKNLLGMKIKLIPGYRGSSSIKLAIQRGEVQGACGISLSTVYTRYKSLVDAGNYNIVLQVGPKPHPDLKDTPHVYKFAKSDEDRKVFDLIFGAQGLGRSFMATAEVPAARGKALQKAFMDTMKDPQLLAEAKKINLRLRPVPGPEVAAFVKQAFKTPKPVVERAKKAIAFTPIRKKKKK